MVKANESTEPKDCRQSDPVDPQFCSVRHLVVPQELIPQGRVVKNVNNLRVLLAGKLLILCTGQHVAVELVFHVRWLRRNCCYHTMG